MTNFFSSMRAFFASLFSCSACANTNCIAQPPNSYQTFMTAFKCTAPISVFLIYDKNKVKMGTDTIFKLSYDDTLEEQLLFLDNSRYLLKCETFPKISPSICFDMDRVIALNIAPEHREIIPLMFNQTKLYKMLYILHVNYHGDARRLRLVGHNGMLEDMKSRQGEGRWEIGIENGRETGEMYVLIEYATLEFPNHIWNINPTANASYHRIITLRGT